MGLRIKSTTTTGPKTEDDIGLRKTGKSPSRILKKRKEIVSDKFANSAEASPDKSPRTSKLVRPAKKKENKERIARLKSLRFSSRKIYFEIQRRESNRR